jgi:hypothetical protein
LTDSSRFTIAGDCISCSTVTSRQAMVDFTNIALKSYVTDLMEKAAKQLKQSAEASEGKSIPEPAAPTPAKSSLILTDM